MRRLRRRFPLLLVVAVSAATIAAFAAGAAGAAVPTLSVRASRSVGSAAVTASPTAADPVERARTLGFELVETRTARLWIADRERVHPAAVDSLDAFVDRAARLLGFSRAQRARLAQEKFDYLLCADPNEVAALSGRESEGVTLLEQGAIVTRWLPHDHEVVHLLVYRRLAPLPPVAEPFLQEGLASALGGRHDEDAAALQAEGERLLACGEVSLETLWGFPRFHALAGPAARSYPVAARFVAFLLDEGGPQRLLRLYRLLASGFEDVVLRPAGVVLQQIEGEYGRSWDALQADFAAWRAAHTPLRLSAAVAPRRSPDLVARDRGRSVALWRDADGSVIVRLAGGSGTPDGVILWGDVLPRGYRCGLLPAGVDPVGRRYALRVEPEGAELCDFALDRVLARHDAAHGPCGDPAEGMFDPRARTVTVRIPAALVRRTGPIGPLRLRAALALPSGE
jgi:hypothetical protein